MAQNQELRRENRDNDVLRTEREEVVATLAEERVEQHSDQARCFCEDAKGDSSRRGVRATAWGDDNKQHRDSNRGVVTKLRRVEEAARRNIEEDSTKAQPSNEYSWSRRCMELEASLRRVEEEKDSFMEQARIKIDGMSRQIQSLQDENRSYKDQLNREATIHARTKQSLGADISSLEKSLDQEKKNQSSMKLQLERKYSEMNQLLKVRSAELKSAEFFLNNVERFARDELVNMVESLNSRIFEAAGFMGELHFGHPTGELTPENVRLKKMVGSAMLSLLVVKPPEAEPLPLQLALQQYMILQCIRNLTSFCSSVEHNSFLNELYEKIIYSGESMSGRRGNNTLNPFRGTKCRRTVARDDLRQVKVVKPNRSAR